MLRVGLTGGVGAGKSAVSELLRARGAIIIDSDVIARSVFDDDPSAVEELTSAFGPDVLLPDGTVNRPALASIVFADAEKLAELNAIVHPRVGAEADRQEAVASARDSDAVVVHDIPLLVETSQIEDFDLIVVVEAPLDTRLDRLVSGRGWTREQALARMAAQASDGERRAIADVVIDNSGTAEDLDAAVDQLWHTRLRLMA